MKKIFGIMFIGLIWFGVCFAEPNVLKCKKIVELQTQKVSFHSKQNFQWTMTDGVEI